MAEVDGVATTDSRAQPLPAGLTKMSLSQVRGSLDPTEGGSLRTLAGALVDLAVQILRDDKQAEESEEVAA